MTAFALQLRDKGEEVKSVIILLEPEFPQMMDKVGTTWIEEVRKGAEGL